MGYFNVRFVAAWPMITGVSDGGREGDAVTVPDLYIVFCYLGNLYFTYNGF